MITEEALVEALIDQMTSTRPIVEVVYQAEILNPKELIDVIELQNRENKSFVNACEKLGIMKDEIKEVIQTEIYQKRAPLGHILVQQGRIDLDTLTRALDDFLDEQEVPDETDLNEIVSEPNFHDVDRSVLSGHLEHLTAERSAELKNIVSQLEGGSFKEVQESFQSLEEAFAQIKKSSRFIRAEMTSRLCAATHHMILSAQEKEWGNNEELKGEIREIVSNVIELLWALRGSLEDSGSEEYFWQVESSQDAYIETMKRIIRLQKSSE